MAQAGLSGTRQMPLDKAFRELGAKSLLDNTEKYMKLLMQYCIKINT